MSISFNLFRRSSLLCTYGSPRVCYDPSSFPHWHPLQPLCIIFWIVNTDTVSLRIHFLPLSITYYFAVKLGLGKPKPPRKSPQAVVFSISGIRSSEREQRGGRHAGQREENTGQGYQSSSSTWHQSQLRI